MDARALAEHRNVSPRGRTASVDGTWHSGLLIWLLGIGGMAGVGWLEWLRKFWKVRARQYRSRFFKENFIFAEFFRDLQKLQIFAPLETQAL